MTERIAYTARETSDATGLSVNRIYELAAKGEIPAVRVGGLWRFPVRRLAEWFEGGGVVAGNSTANRGRVAS